MSDALSRGRRHKFTFGLWTVGNPGRDPFGEPYGRLLSPVEIVASARGGRRLRVHFHDDDLIPDRASPPTGSASWATSEGAGGDGAQGPMATTNLFGDPSFKTARFTSNDARVRAYALQKTMRNIDLGVELGAKVYVFWGGAKA